MPSSSERSLQPAPETSLLSPLFVVAFYAAFLAFALLKVYPGAVHFDTTELYMWSTLGFKLGYARHPPLLSWLVGAWTFILPANWITLTLLAVTNVTLGAYAVWRISEIMIGPRRAVLAMVLYMISPSTTLHAVKLDHSSVLVSLWPLTVWAFLLAIREPTWRRGLMLGLAATLSMYAKYSSALLLFALFLAALVSDRRAEFFRSTTPYLAVIVVGILFAPHVWWVAQDGWATVKFASANVAPAGHLPRSMLTGNLVRALPVLAGFTVMWRWIGPSRTGHDFQRDLLVILVTTYVLTIGITAVLGLRGSGNWSMPVFAFLPTALCGLLSNPTDRQISTARRFALGFMAILPLGGIAMLASSFKQGSESAVEPDFEVAKESAAVFSKAFGAPVRIVGGSVRYSTSATLDLPGHPRAWVHFNDYWWITPEMIAENGALGLCAVDDDRCRQRAQQIVIDRKGWTCEIERRRTLWGMQGKKTKVYLYFIPPQQLMASLPPAESRCPPPLLP